jgi:hypothetical protein
VEVNLCRFFIFFFLSYICTVLRWRYNCQEVRVGILLTGLTSPHLCACPKPGPGFPMSYVTVLSYVQWSWFEVGGDFIWLILVELLTITV